MGSGGCRLGEPVRPVAWNEEVTTWLAHLVLVKPLKKYRQMVTVSLKKRGIRTHRKLAIGPLRPEVQMLVALVLSRLDREAAIHE